MRVFVTGGTGFIGAHFINQAHQAGDTVVALRRGLGATSVPLEKQPIWVDGCLDGELLQALQSCDAVVHFAAHTPNPPYDSLNTCLYWNLTAPIRLFDQAVEAGVKRFIVAGSCFEYGRSGERYEFIPHDAPLLPTASYPTSKAAASVAFCGFAAERNVELALYRIFQVFGEGELQSRLWPSLRAAALRGDNYPMTWGEQVRDFIPVEEVAAFFLWGLHQDDIQPGIARIRNVGTGVPQTVRRFAEYWWSVWRAKGELQFGAVPYRKNEVMRFVPQIESGLRG